jgi:hypothetical protein
MNELIYFSQSLKMTDILFFSPFHLKAAKTLVSHTF